MYGVIGVINKFLLIVIYMRKISTALVSILSLTSSLAYAEGYYGSLSLGGARGKLNHRDGISSINSTEKFTGLPAVTSGFLGTSSDDGIATYPISNKITSPKTKGSAGFMGEAAIGKHFTQNLRGEVAFSYMYQKAKKHVFYGNRVVESPILDTGTCVPGTTGSCTVTLPTNRPTSGPTSYEFGVKLASFGLMLNGYYDLTLYSAVTPYVMAGIGVARNKYKIVSDAADIAGKSATKNNVVWQIGAGLNIPITYSTDLGFGYRLRSGGGKVKKGVFKDYDIAARPVSIFLANVKFGF